MPRFLCDAMLGSLARWLRLFGYDAELSGAPDAELAERARREERWLLTRDRELASVGPRSLLVRSDGLEEQLVEVFRRLGVTPVASLSSARCSRCNGVLADLDRGDAEGVVPPHVARTAPRFRRCTSCGAVYWPGSHTERILARLRRVAEAVAGVPVTTGGR
ncbi:MAG: hypothetical protein GXP47_15305 [Acidobacteria bacterium]|nr:hypothetical protein [Acidobacteriota bacterium]